MLKANQKQQSQFTFRLPDELHAKIEALVIREQHKRPYERICGADIVRSIIASATMSVGV